MSPSIHIPGGSRGRPSGGKEDRVKAPLLMSLLYLKNGGKPTLPRGFMVRCTGLYEKRLIPVIIEWFTAANKFVRLL